MIKKILVPLAFTFIITACQFVDNAPTSMGKREYAYLNAKSEAPLRTPAGVNDRQFHAEFSAVPPAKPLSRLDLAPSKID